MSELISGCSAASSGQKYNYGVFFLKCNSVFHIDFCFLFLCCQCFFVSQISGASVEETLTGEVILSVLKVTVNKPALYTCLASNKHSAGANTVKATAKVTVAGRDTFFYLLSTLQNERKQIPNILVALPSACVRGLG